MNLNALTNIIFSLHAILVQATQLRVERHNSLNLQEWTDICGCCHGFANFERWNANEAGEFIQIRPDYNETQLAECGGFCRGCETLLERADRERERGSVSIAVRRLKRANLIGLFAPRPVVGRKCSEAVSARTDRAIGKLADRYYRGTQMKRADEDQQAIFEAQMIRLGDADQEIAEWEAERWTYCVSPHRFETVTLASQPTLFGHSIRRRYQGHYGYDW